MRFGRIELDKCVGCLACVLVCKERWDTGPSILASACSVKNIPAHQDVQQAPPILMKTALWSWIPKSVSAVETASIRAVRAHVLQTQKKHRRKVQ